MKANKNLSTEEKEKKVAYMRNYYLADNYLTTFLGCIKQWGMEDTWDK